ncbi:MAG: SxtJ family membrane protein [Candidatus Omnitrophota bacterium]
MKTTDKDLRKFGITLGIILFFFAMLNFFKQHTNIYPWFLSFAGLSFFTAILIPKALSPVFFIFTKFAHMMAWINTGVILIIAFYLLVFPIGIIMRIFNKDPLDKKIDKKADSYWIAKIQTKADRQSLERQF